MAHKTMHSVILITTVTCLLVFMLLYFAALSREASPVRNCAIQAQGKMQRSECAFSHSSAKPSRLTQMYHLTTVWSRIMLHDIMTSLLAGYTRAI
jgi:hypothetical protein